jgi:hypothetical protein
MLMVFPLLDVELASEECNLLHLDWLESLMPKLLVGSHEHMFL